MIVDQAESFPQRFSVPLFEQLELDQGIVYAQGNDHRRNKRVCVPSFEQSRSMAFFISAIKSETNTLVSRWEREFAGKTEPFDLYDECRKLTLEVVLRVTFGVWGVAGGEVDACKPHPSRQGGGEADARKPHPSRPQAPNSQPNDASDHHLWDGAGGGA